MEPKQSWKQVFTDEELTELVRQARVKMNEYEDPRELTTEGNKKYLYLYNDFLTLLGKLVDEAPEQIKKDHEKIYQSLSFLKKQLPAKLYNMKSGYEVKQIEGTEVMTPRSVPTPGTIRMNRFICWVRKDYTARTGRDAIIVHNPDLRQVSQDYLTGDYVEFLEKCADLAGLDRLKVLNRARKLR